MKKNTGVLNYITNSLNGMALGLFSSLIIGLIIKQIGIIFNFNLLIDFGNIAQKLMGPAIGAGVAYSIKAPPLGILAGVVSGAIGAGSITTLEGATSIAIGEPVGAYIAAIVGAEASKFVSGKTKVDIILIPMSGIILGGLVGNYLAPGISKVMLSIGNFINLTTELHPLPMGIIVSVLMGMLLTLPISSAAIAISLNLSGIAAGAATVGCAANMIGFAVSSYDENGFGGFIAQGIGTSMLQIPNIVRKPRIWLPAIITSAVLGPISSVVLKMESSSIGAGMGTSGLVGQIAVLDTMGYDIKVIIEILLMHFILPGIISFYISRFMKKRGYIRKGDMKLN
ncbi:MAG TPA: PTS sugar transporter subunit IIC [Tissierellaceae bacterium]